MPQYSVLLRYIFYGTIRIFLDYKDHTAMADKIFCFIENYLNSVIRFFFQKCILHKDFYMTFDLTCRTSLTLSLINRQYLGEQTLANVNKRGWRTRRVINVQSSNITRRTINDHLNYQSLFDLVYPLSEVKLDKKSPDVLGHKTIRYSLESIDILADRNHTDNPRLPHSAV